MQVPTNRAEAIARAARGELLGPMDMAAIWCIGRTQFGNLKRAGAFDVFMVRPAIGPRCYSGAKVHRHLQGEPIDEPVMAFGRKRRAS